jgi:hypothetical protein
MHRAKEILKNPLAIILFVGFIIALVYAFYFKIPPLVDARGYDNIGWHLAEGYGYREFLTTPLLNDVGIVRVGPGYEFFLAGIFLLFGHSYPAVWIIQSLLLMGTGYFAYALSREVFKAAWQPLIGYSAAALVVFSPDLITINAMLMTETLGIFLAVLATYLFFKYVNQNSDMYLFWSVVTLFSATLARTPAVFLFIPLFGYLLWQKHFKKVFLLLILVAALATPWTVRNYKIYGAFVPFHAGGNYNIVIGNHEGATGEQDPYPKLGEYLEKYGAIEAGKLAKAEGFSFIRSHPLEFVRLTLSRTITYFSGARPTGFWFHLTGTSKATTLVLSSLYAFLLFSSGFFGLASARTLASADHARAKLYRWFLVMMPLAVVGLVVETRYRFLLYPFLAVFAGYGIYRALLTKPEKKLLIGSIGAVIAIAVVDVLRNLDRILERISDI